MISILNSIFTGVFYVTRRTKLDSTCICFKEFINQLNLLYICMFIFATRQELCDAQVGPWTMFFARPSLAQ
jgi:hypothetical protein